MHSCLLQLLCKTLIKLSCLTSSLVCLWHQCALSSHLENNTWDFYCCSSYISSTDTSAIGTAKVCPCLYVQIAVAALLMFREDGMVYFKPTRRSVGTGVCTWIDSDFCTFLHSTVLPLSPVANMLLDRHSACFISSGTVLWLSSYSIQKVVFPCITEGATVVQRPCSKAIL